MAPYIGEIRMFGGNFPPNGWAFCQGQPLSIAENTSLFQLIGTTYGGDGETTFNLPNLASRVPIHMGTGQDGTNYVLGEMAGTEMVTLTTQQISSHTHPLQASNAGAVLSPQDAVLTVPTSSQAGVRIYHDSLAPNQTINANVAPAGGSQPHDNKQPYLCINFIISLFGLYPSQT